MRSVILAIDEGTTNAKAVCINREGQIIARGASGLEVTHPQPAWSEQGPMAILKAVSHAIESACQGEDFKIEGIGISNQRESVLIWDRLSGAPLSPVVVWQCRRSEAFCDELAKGSFAKTIKEKTGLPIDPLFPAAKIRWLLDHIQNGFSRATSGEICIGTIDAWLLWNLTGQEVFATDESNASRTQLLNIYTGQWDEELCSIFGVPMNALPEVLPSSGLRGYTRGWEGLPDGIPIFSQIGDSHAALYGQGGFRPGMIKATYGTGSSLMTPVAEIAPSDDRLAKTIAWNDGERTYALEGNITHTGAGASYMSKLLGLSNIDELSHLAESIDTSDGVYFVPALSGLGAPYWQSKARGLIAGLTESALPAHLARASFEAIAYQVADVFFLMQEMAGEELRCLLVDGGPTQNQWLMQFQSNVIHCPLARSQVAEVSALGAGYLAGKTLGWWPDRATLANLPRIAEEISQNANQDGVSKLYEGWKRAITQTLASL